MNQNKKMIEVLLNIYEYELLELFQLQMAEANGYDINKDREKELRKKLNITKNDIITWCNTGELPKNIEDK